MRDKLTYSNVISTLCLVLLVGGGTAFAASQLPKNSVGSKQLKKNSVTGAKIKNDSIVGPKIANETITGAKIKLSTLGTVPSATHAASADTIPPAEASHLVGAPGEPGFLGGSINTATTAVPGLRFPPVSFYKDAFGIVHLDGVAEVGGGGGPIFTLPPGYRPAAGQIEAFEPVNEAIIFILGSSVEGIAAGTVFGENGTVLLSGITYRAGS